jgi:hypothetical protein
MEQIEIILQGLRVAEETILDSLEPKGLISDNLTLEIFHQMEHARKNLISNG